MPVLIYVGMILHAHTRKKEVPVLVSCAGIGVIVACVCSDEDKQQQWLGWSVDGRCSCQTRLTLLGRFDGYWHCSSHSMKRSMSVRPSVCLFRHSTAACDGFAAARRAGGRYRSATAAAGCRARQAQGARAAAAPQHRPQHGAQQQMRGLDSKSELHLCRHETITLKSNSSGQKEIYSENVSTCLLKFFGCLLHIYTTNEMPRLQLT